MHLQEAFLEARNDFYRASASIGHFVEWIDSVYVAAHQIVFPLQPVVDQILELFHFDLHDYFVY